MSDTTTGEIYIDLSGDGGVLKNITSEGVGVETPTDGCKVSIHYTSKSMDGEVFDSSLYHYIPFDFQLGRGSVIKAFDIGIATMKLGEKCVLICTPDYGYGEGGSGSIPPNATIVFELEMLGWKAEDLCPDVDSGIRQILGKSEKKRRKRRQRPYVKIEHDFKWSGSATKLFVEAYKKRKDRFCIPEINQKGLWTEILWEMSGAGYQVDNEAMLACKMRNMKCNYKKLKEKQIRGRGRPIVWEYFNDFEEFFHNDPNFICGLNDTTQCIAAAEESEDDENAGQGQGGFKWTRKATKFFVAMYRKRMNHFRTPSIIKKKRLWNEILREMRDAGFQVDSPETLSRKMLAMKTTFKFSKEKKSRGRGRVLWEYFDDFQEMFDRDPASCDPALNDSASFQDDSITFTGTSEFVDGDDEESESEENPGFNIKWSKKATKFLVTAYSKRKERFRDPKIKKKNLWSEILHEMTVAGFQVENEAELDSKMRNMKHTYKLTKENYSKGLRDQISWKYFDMFREIFDNDSATCGPALNDTGSFNENFTTYTDTPEFVEVAEESKVEENAGPRSNQHDFKWSEEATQFLVASYVKRKDQFRDPRNIKKYLWSEILREMSVAGFQVLNEEALILKMWRMRYTFKRLKFQKSRGHDGICWEYFDTFEEIFDSEPANCDPVLNDTASFQENFKTFADTPEFIEVTGESELENYGGQNQHNFHWSCKATKFFLAAYKKRRPRFRDRKTKQKYLWPEILREMNVAGFQVGNEKVLARKMWRMMSIFKKMKVKKRRGHDRISWKYFDTFVEMFDSGPATCNPALNDTASFQENFKTFTDTPEFIEDAGESDVARDSDVVGESKLENNGNFKWSGEATKLVVAAYKKRRHRFRDPQIKKKKLWSEILREMRAAGFQVENETVLDAKIRNMKFTYNKIKNNCRKGFRDKISWEYFDTFQEIFDNKPANCGPALDDTASFQENFKTFTETSEFVDVAEESDVVEESDVAEENELENNGGQNQPNFKWTGEATNFVVAAYKKRKDRFRDPKTKKKKLWSEILREMRAVGFHVENEAALDAKMRNMKFTYKKIKDNRSKGSRGQITWEYYDAFQELFDNPANCGSALNDTASFKENFTKYTDTPEFVDVAEESADAEESELEEIAGQNQLNFKWSGEATKLFLAAYKKRRHNFIDPISKIRRLWSEIRREMSTAGFQVENEDVLDAKMRNMKKTYKIVKASKREDVGRDRISWKYFNAFVEIFDSDPAVNSDPVLPFIEIREDEEDERAASCSETSSSSRNRSSSLYYMRKKKLAIEDRRVQALAETNRLLAERNDLLRELIQAQQESNSTPASDEANKS